MCRATSTDLTMPFSFLEYQHGLQIILARRMEFFHRRDLFSIQ